MPEYASSVVYLLVKSWMNGYIVWDFVGFLYVDRKYSAQR